MARVRKGSSKDRWSCCRKLSPRRAGVLPDAFSAQGLHWAGAVRGRAVCSLGAKRGVNPPPRWQQ